MTITICTSQGEADAVKSPKQVSWIGPEKWEVKTGADLEAAVPQVLSSRQFWVAVEDKDLTASIAAAVSASPKRTQIEVSQATEFVRTYPLLGVMAMAIGKTEADIDDLFRHGASL